MNPALANWIKQEQKEKEEHAKKMALKNQKDDEVYMNFIKTLIKLKLTPKEKIMVCNLLRYKKEGHNWSPAQRSVITNIYYKHAA
jgi:hypothetical protein